MEVRSAKKEDYRSVKKLYEQFAKDQDERGLEFEQNDFMDDMEPWEKMIKDKHSTTLVAEDASDIVGFLTVRRKIFNPFRKRGKLGEIDLLMVAHDYRRKGVGKLLVEQGIEHLRKRGFNLVFLNVRADNPAEKFWEKMGFRKISHTDLEWKNGRSESIYFMLRDI